MSTCSTEAVFVSSDHHSLTLLDVTMAESMPVSGAPLEGERLLAAGLSTPLRTLPIPVGRHPGSGAGMTGGWSSALTTWPTVVAKVEAMVTPHATAGASATGAANATTVRGPRAGARYAFEAIGTFLLVIAVGAAAESGSPLAVLGIGAVLIAMVYAGGHYNPAVTLAVLIRRRVGLSEAIALWALQIGAGVLAAVVVRAIVDPTRASATAAITLTGHTLVAAFAVELLVIFVLCYMATSGDHRDDSYYSLAIGFTTVASAFAVAAIAGGAFNATLSLGAVVTLSVYLVAQVLGGIAAGVSSLANESRQEIKRQPHNERNDNA
jgi:aquaporin Z